MSLWKTSLTVVLVFIGLHLNEVSSAIVPVNSTHQPCNTNTTAPFQLPIPFSVCYIEETKVFELLTWMAAVIRILNTDQDYVESMQGKLKKVPELQEYATCSEHRIEMLTQELRWASRRLWELSDQNVEPEDPELKQLDQRKIDLIRHLHNVQVFTGGSTPTSSMLLTFFDTQVEFLDFGFNTALTKFQHPVHSASYKAAVRSILDPQKSTAELVKLARDQPEAMSEALPQLISNWYDGQLKNVADVLRFIKTLPNLGHQVLGYVSLYGSMSAHSHLESYELTQLVHQLKGINASVSYGTDNSRSVMTRYTKLVEDVWPVYQLALKGANTSCYFGNSKYSSGMNLVNDRPQLNPSESYHGTWTVHGKPDAALYHLSWYASVLDVFSSSKRTVKYGSLNSEFGQWKFIPVAGGQYFRILNAKFDEVLFADKNEMDSKNSTFRRVFLARHDYLLERDIEPGADLWTIECN